MASVRKLIRVALEVPQNSSRFRASNQPLIKLQKNFDDEIVQQIDSSTPLKVLILFLPSGSEVQIGFCILQYQNSPSPEHLSFFFGGTRVRVCVRGLVFSLVRSESDIVIQYDSKGQDSPSSLATT